MGTHSSPRAVSILASSGKLKRPGRRLSWKRLSGCRLSVTRHRNCMGYSRCALAFATKPFSPNYLKAYWPNHVRFTSTLKSTDEISPRLKTPLPLAGLGLSRTVRVGLKLAFPGVTNATNAQSTFVPAIIRGKDVMIKGQMGSGKCVKFVVWMSNVGLTMLH